MRAGDEVERRGMRAWRSCLETPRGSPTRIRPLAGWHARGSLRHWRRTHCALARSMRLRFAAPTRREYAPTSRRRRNRRVLLHPRITIAIPRLSRKPNALICQLHRSTPTFRRSTTRIPFRIVSSIGERLVGSEWIRVCLESRE